MMLYVCVVYRVCVFFSLPGEWSGGLIISTAVGWSVSVGLGLLCCIYVATLHENDLWFSNIKVRVLRSSFHHRPMWLMKQQPSVMCRRSILSNGRERVELPKTTRPCQRSCTATFCSEEFAFCFANLWSLICLCLFQYIWRAVIVLSSTQLGHDTFEMLAGSRSLWMSWSTVVVLEVGLQTTFKGSWSWTGLSQHDNKRKESFSFTSSFWGFSQPPWVRLMSIFSVELRH